MSQSLIPEEYILTTRPTHKLKHDRSVLFTRRVQIKNQAHSLSVKEWPDHVSLKECIIKVLQTHHLRKEWPARAFNLEVRK